ncbi:conserved hypothetical protein [Planktothrix sp. PCC 11201]|uniref:DUF4276 family protein n=1 Tax=Planktothrix sp. PCC 11201 TaxID=1729650 RepID=UPI000920AF53|nr:DUF4276 family protein [Planktothrix sp. PCC 11201]SKB15142.1 conserved hypothetical protein [Planktothrix sp. PCC 11201]
MKIAILVEGATERAFREILHEFLKKRLGEGMPRLKFIPQGGRIPKEGKLKRTVKNLLDNDGYDAVIALTDVYTGTNDFKDATDAKNKMNNWVGNNPNFYPHTALHDFEAWLLPYWKTIQEKAKHNRSAPSGSPETVNHNKPPSYHIIDIFRSGKRGRDYDKIIDGKAILEKNDLMIAIQTCPELKAFVNRIISLCDPDQVIP